MKILNTVIPGELLSISQGLVPCFLKEKIYYTTGLDKQKCSA